MLNHYIKALYKNANNFSALWWGRMKKDRDEAKRYTDIEGRDKIEDVKERQNKKNIRDYKREAERERERQREMGEQGDKGKKEIPNMKNTFKNQHIL